MTRENQGYIFPQQEKYYSGKTREMYFTKDGFVANIASNRLSAFNQIFDVMVPHKGAVLNSLAAYFLRETEHIVPNWYLSSPNAITSVGLAGTIIPYEIIVRQYLVGSAWRAYKKGVRKISGVILPDGLEEYSKFSEPIITPTRKSENDESISREEIIAEGNISKEDYEQIEKYALKLFQSGQEMAQKANLILVDTKYEFMFNNKGKIMLADEVHTPDSSRYFYLEDFNEKMKTKDKPKQLSKEFFREWLMDNGYGEDESLAGKPLPNIAPKVIKELSDKYIKLYEMITGLRFQYGESTKAEDMDFVFLSSRLAIQQARFPESKPSVGIIMGSDSDLPKMDAAAFFLEEMGVDYELTICSAHRTPERMEEYAKSAVNRGLKVIIAGAGGAAHLPGMIAGGTTLPVIGVPIKSHNSINGIDSLLSIVQMPSGVPVLTVSIDGAKNAGISAVQILGAFDSDIGQKIIQFKKNLKSKVQRTVVKVSDIGYPCSFVK